jgi:hypothetical protein
MPEAQRVKRAQWIYKAKQACLIFVLEMH